RPDIVLATSSCRAKLCRVPISYTRLLAAGPPGRADLTLRAITQVWTGLGQGSGRLRRRLLEITAEGRGIAGHRTFRVLLPQIDGRIAEHPRTREEREPVRLLRPVRRAG